MSMDDSSIRARLGEIFTIASKELTHCLRDSHVIIYSLILPVVFYPLIIIGASEFALWREGLTEKCPIKVAIDKASKEQLTFLTEKIGKFKKVEAVDSDKPMEELSSRKIDCYIKLKPDRSGMVAYLNPAADRYLETKVLITTLTASAKSAAVKARLDDSGLHKDLLRVYSVKLNSLAEIRETKRPEQVFNKYAMIKSLIIGVLCVYTLIIVQSGTVYPALTAFTLEIEKKTILTTQLIPVPGWHLIIGKFLSVLAVSFTTALINISSLAFVVLYFLVKMPWSKELIDRTVKNVSAPDVLSVIMVFVLSIILLSSAYSFVASVAKSFKEAQNISSLILIVTMLLPAVAMIPGVTLGPYTVFIPLTNLVLAAKSVVTEEASVPLIILAVSLNLLVSLVFLNLSKLGFYDALPQFLGKFLEKSDGREIEEGTSQVQG